MYSHSLFNNVNDCFSVMVLSCIDYSTTLRAQATHGSVSQPSSLRVHTSPRHTTALYRSACTQAGQGSVRGGWCSNRHLYMTA